MDVVGAWLVEAKQNVIENMAPVLTRLFTPLFTLLLNLGCSAIIYARFFKRRTTFAALERWQTAYLPGYAIWASVVAVLFPVVFGFR